MISFIVYFRLLATLASTCKLPDSKELSDSSELCQFAPSGLTSCFVIRKACLRALPPEEITMQVEVAGWVGLCFPGTRLKRDLRILAVKHADCSEWPRAVPVTKVAPIVCHPVEKSSDGYGYEQVRK